MLAYYQSARHGVPPPYPRLAENFPAHLNTQQLRIENVLEDLENVRRLGDGGDASLADNFFEEHSRENFRSIVCDFLRSQLALLPPTTITEVRVCVFVFVSVKCPNPPLKQLISAVPGVCECSATG